MLASLVLPAAPGYPALMPRRPHPDGYIRVSLLMKMLRTCGVADWTAAADAIDRLWYAPLGPKPDWIEPFVDADSDAVVDVLLNAPVPTLTHDGVGHSLSELVRDPGGDAGRTAALASYLGDGVDRPDPNSPDRFPWRLVPLAAQLASMQADGTTLETIHRRALQYLRAIERPEFLGPNVDRDAVTRRRARELDPAVLAAEVDAGGDANA